MTNRSLTAALLFMVMGSPSRASEADFTSWARSRLAPIGDSGQAFRSLDRAVEAAQLIGMGESVHESEPFLSFRVQFMKDLVRRHRVTALVFESGLAEAMALDDYVLGRTGTIDYEAALPGGFANLVEIRRALEWIREWNLGPGRGRPVHVYGADVPGRQASMLPGLDRLQELTSGHAQIRVLIEAVRPIAIQTSAPWWKPAQARYSELLEDAKRSWTEGINRLLDAVNQLNTGDPDRLEWSRRVALVVKQNEVMLRLGGFSPTAPREQAMADNTMWVLGRLGQGERAVYWAHNAHVQRVPVTGPPLPKGTFPSAGTLLAAKLSDKYLAVGTAYGGASRDGGAAVISGSVDAALGAVAKGSFLLSFTGAARSEDVESWLAAKRPMRFQVQHLMVPLGKAFDVVAYFEGATAARRVEP